MALRLQNKYLQLVNLNLKADPITPTKLFDKATVTQVYLKAGKLTGKFKSPNGFTHKVKQINTGLWETL